MDKIKLIFILIALTLWSCDKPDGPYLDAKTDLGSAEGVISYGSSFFASYESTVLLEDFTGYKCTNCGPALATSELLSDQWGDRIVVVGYHVLDFFAKPDIAPAPPNFVFSKDFRTDEGEALAQEYNVLSLPQGLVNRIDFGSGALQLAGNWAGRVSDAMNSNPKAFVDVIADSIKVENEILSFAIAIRPLTEVDEDWNLIVGLYENDLIEGQKDGGETIYPFSHQHVFRGYVNGRAGQPVITTNLNFASGEAVYYKFNTDLESDWTLENTENCYLFAFLQNSVTQEIYAVAKAPLL